MKSGYIQSLTPLRGIAAIWVIIFHVDAIFGIFGYTNLLPREATGIFGKGYLWVDFFFLLSGFIITHVYGEGFSKGLTGSAFRAYAWARFTRIYPLHIVMLLILIAVFLVIQSLNAEQAEILSVFYAWDAIPLHMVMGHAMGFYDNLSWNVPSWSIAAEWWTYLIAVILFPVLNRGANRFTILFTLICFCLLGGLVYSLPNMNLDLTHDYGIYRCLLEFMIGINVYQLFRDEIWRTVLQRDLSFLVCALLILSGMHFQINDLLFIPLFSFLILSAAWNNQRMQKVLNSKLLNFMGEISYSVYMVQGLYLTLQIVVINHYRPLLEGMTDSWKWLLLCGVLLMTIITSVITHRLVEVKMREELRYYGKKVSSRIS